VVLVDTAHEQMFERLPAEVTAGVAEFADLVRGQRRMMFTGLPRLRGLCGQAPGVLEHLAGAFAFNGCRTSFLKTLEQELDVIRTDAVEVAQAGSLRDLPLVVVTRDFTLPDFDLPEDVALRATTVGLELQRELAALSSRGRLVTADRSGHYVPFDRPDVVTQAIRDVTDDIRRR